MVEISTMLCSLTPAALEPDLVVADAEPPDEPAAGVAGAVSGQRNRSP